MLLSFHDFFFSSRRRHTRLQGDWSSDVCSSDLVVGVPGDRLEMRENRLFVNGRPAEYQLEPGPEGDRSEERRVGKESRTRGMPEQKKKKRELGEIAKERVYERYVIEKNSSANV